MHGIKQVQSTQGMVLKMSVVLKIDRRLICVHISHANTAVTPEFRNAHAQRFGSAVLPSPGPQISFINW